MATVLVGGRLASGRVGWWRRRSLVCGLRAAGAGRLVLIVEDVHWADQSTLDLVAFLARALRSSRLLLVITFRSDEVDRRHPLRHVLVELARLRGVVRIDLEPFGRAEVRRQVWEVLGGEPAADVVEALHVRSGGNAFLVEELPAQGARDGSRPAITPSLRTRRGVAPPCVLTAVCSSTPNRLMPAS